MARQIGERAGTSLIAKKTILGICLVIIIAWLAIAFTVSTSFDYDIWSGENKTFNVFTIVTGVCMVLGYGTYRMIPSIKNNVRVALKRIPEKWNSLMDSGMTPYFKPEYNIVKNGRYVKALDESIEADSYGLPIVNQETPLSSFNMDIYKRYYKPLFESFNMIKQANIRQAYKDPNLSSIFQLEEKIATFFDIMKERIRVQLIGTDCMIVKPFHKPHLLIHKNAYLSFVQDMQRDVNWELDTKRQIKNDEYDSAKLAGLRWLLSVTVANSDYANYANQGLYAGVYKELWALSKIFPDNIEVVYRALLDFVRDSSNKLGYAYLENAAARLVIRADIMNYEPVIVQSIEAKLSTNEVVDMIELYKYLTKPDREHGLPMKTIISNSVRMVEIANTEPMFRRLESKSDAIARLKVAMATYVLPTKVPYIEIQIIKLLKYLQGDALVVVQNHNRDNSKSVKASKRITKALQDMRMPSISVGHLSVHNPLKAITKNQHMFDNMFPNEKQSIVKAKAQQNIDLEKRTKAIQDELKEIAQLPEIDEKTKERREVLEDELKLLIESKSLTEKILGMQQKLIDLAQRRSHQLRYGTKTSAKDKEINNIKKELESMKEKREKINETIAQRATPVFSKDDASKVATALVAQEAASNEVVELETIIPMLKESLRLDGQLNAMKEENARLKAETNNKISALNLNINTMHDEYMTEKVKLSNLQSQLSQAVSNVQQRENELRDLERASQVRLLAHDTASKAQISALHRDIVSKKEELDRARMEVQKQGSNMSELQSKFQEMKDRAMEYLKDIENHKMQNADLDNALQRTKRELETSYVTNEEQRVQMAAIQAESTKTKNELDRSLSDLNNQKHNLLRLKLCRAVEAAKAKHTTYELDKTKSELDMQAKRVKEEQTKLDNILRTSDIPFSEEAVDVSMRLAQVLGTLKQSQNETNTLQAKEQLLMEENATLNARYVVEQQHIVELQRQIDQLAIERDTAATAQNTVDQQQINQLSAKLNDKMTLLSELKSSKATLAEERDAIKLKLDEAAEREKVNAKEMSRLREEKELLMRQIKENTNNESVRAQVLDLSNQLARATAQTEQMAKKEAEYVELRKKHDNHQQELEELRQELHNQTTIVQELREQADMTKQLAKETAKHHVEELDILKNGYQNRLFSCFQQGASNPFDIQDLIPVNTTVSENGRTTNFVLTKTHYEEMSNLLNRLLNKHVPKGSQEESAILKNLYSDILSIGNIQKALPLSAEPNTPLVINLIKVAAFMVSLYQYHNSHGSKYNQKLDAIKDCNIPFDTPSPLKTVEVFQTLAWQFFFDVDNDAFGHFLNNNALANRLPTDPDDALAELTRLGFWRGEPAIKVSITSSDKKVGNTITKKKHKANADSSNKRRLMPASDPSALINHISNSEPINQQVNNNEVDPQELDALWNEIAPQNTYDQRPITGMQFEPNSSFMASTHSEEEPQDSIEPTSWYDPSAAQNPPDEDDDYYFDNVHSF